jgi:uncharacterized SAM-binding protein YcdF (DUF218 family)
MKDAWRHFVRCATLEADEPAFLVSTAVADPMEFAKRPIEIIFSPLGILSISLFAGIILSFTRKHSRAGRRFLICGASLFLIFLFSPLAQFLMWNLEKDFPPLLMPPELPKADRIVVLAGYGEEHPGFPITSNVSEQTIANMSEGLRLYRLAPKTKLILSGGVAKSGERPVAAMMADFLRQMGVPEQDLVMEGNSQDTYQNLLEVRKLIRANPFILVASGCDMRRAVAVSKKLQMNPIPAPAYIWTLQNHPANATLADEFSNYIKNRGYVSLKNLSRLQWAYHEYLGYVWYRLLDRI